MKQNSFVDHRPHQNNVLCGRNHCAINHAGNVYFRKLVKTFQVRYVFSTKQQKKLYSQIIYDEIRQQNPPGQFLKFEPNTSKWEDIGRTKSLLKIRQALREGAPNLKLSLNILEVVKPTQADCNFEDAANLSSESNQSIINLVRGRRIIPTRYF